MNAWPEEPQAVLDFWFGHDDAVRDEWFRKDRVFDAQIAQRFGPLIERALRGELSAWQAAPESALALIVVLDQFTRNAFRNSPRAFAGDAIALPVARAAVAAGFDQSLTPAQRSFVYLPFEHAEDMASQDEAVRLFTALAKAQPGLADTLDYALRHRAIIERFGRFPHRNAVLGRVSTVEEIEFLKQPGSSF
jgi:uncharacterized protein (DUF924 family)